ncbi:MAG: type II toxin-antitoxin system VapC family toxin [Pirellulales bacterium]|nr:type II toxin-antitoxin system VapC family toxin [Pirellulales bacterium]
MSAAFVVDASVALTWLFKDEATESTDTLLVRLEQETALVPSWWFLEIANVVGLAERKGRITEVESARFISDLLKLGIEVELLSPEQPFSQFLPLARKFALTCYDSMYLELAQRRQLPLASLDEQLHKAAS